MLPTVFLVSLIVFFLIRLIPGDIIDMMLEHTSGAWGIEQIDRADIEARLGLDVPILTQYGRWIGNLSLTRYFSQCRWGNSILF